MIFWVSKDYSNKHDDLVTFVHNQTFFGTTSEVFKINKRILHAPGNNIHERTGCERLGITNISFSEFP